MKISELLGYKLDETATDGATSATNVGVGAIYPNKAPKPKKGLKPNAIDTNQNLMTGGSIKRT